MANKIKFKRGQKHRLPQLSYGEPAFVSDEGELYIGTESTNVKITSKKEVKELDERVSELVASNGDGTKDTEIIDARKGEKSLRTKIDKIDNNLDEINEYMINYPKTEGKQYGVRLMKNSSNPALTRLGDAVGLVANAGVDGQTVVNDFDNIYPWGHRKVCNLSADGRVLAYEGEPGFKRDGSNGNVMVETPIFYQRYVETDEYIEYWIADYNAPGFRLSPRFLTKDRKVLNKIYTGAYKASYNGSKLESKTGIFPAVEAGRHTFRSRAKAIGTGWGLTDIAYRCDILNYLFYIEFATLNSQAIMQGLTSLIWDYKTTAATDNGNVLTLDSTNIVVGFTLRVNNTDRRVIAVDTPNKQVTVDGEPFSVATNVTISSRGWINGETDSVKSSSGSMKSNTDGKNCCKYRGEENPWGNIWEWIDGCNIKDWQGYVHWVPDEYADDKFDSPYEQLGYVHPQSNGYTKRFGFDNNNPYAQLPIDTSGGSTTYYCDYYYQSAGNKALLVGGVLDYGSSAGLVCWNCIYGFTSSYRNLGARLSYKPS